MKELIILRCEDSLEGIFTAIYDAFVYKNNLNFPYNDNIQIAIGEEGNLSLFAKEISIKTDITKAQKTVGAIQNKLGFSVFNTLLLALCHYDDNRATIVLAYLVRAFKTGLQIQEYLADEYVMRVLELSRKVSNEADKMRGFLRFKDINNILISEIEPKCNLVPIIAEHFEDRFVNENFIIYDRKRNYSVVHPAYKQSYFVTGKLINSDKLATNDYFEDLWKQYFNTMEIKERENYNCQRTLLPEWYRKNMVEFN